MRNFVSRRLILKRSLGIAMLGACGSRMSAGIAATTLQGSSKLADNKETPCNRVSDECREAQPIILQAPRIVSTDTIISVSVRVDNSVYARQHENQSTALSEVAYVMSVIVLADLNPEPEIETFSFLPGGDSMVVSTQVNLARSQNIIAVAKLNDGSFVSDSKHIRVLDS